jgi:hypothetical protein
VAKCTAAVTGSRDQTIAFAAAPTGITVGGATGEVSATATSGLPVTFAISSLTAGVCSISSRTITGIAAGTCTIEANQAGDANFKPAPQVAQDVIISPSNGTGGYTCNPDDENKVTYRSNLGTLPLGSGTTHVIPASGMAVGAFAFKVSPNDPTGKIWGFYYAITVTPFFENKDSAISKCPGDFTGKGIPAGVASCLVHGARPSAGISLSVGGTGCSLEKGGDYYLNIRAQQQQGLVISVNPN